MARGHNGDPAEGSSYRDVDQVTGTDAKGVLTRNSSRTRKETGTCD
jgi:hypothetical protein